MREILDTNEKAKLVWKIIFLASRLLRERIFDFKSSQNGKGIMKSQM